MPATAISPLFVHQHGPGRFGVIHPSAGAPVQAPLIWWSARAHRLYARPTSTRGMVVGVPLIAQFFTVPFGRPFGHSFA